MPTWLIPVPAPEQARREVLDDGSVVILDASNHVLDIIPADRAAAVLSVPVDVELVEVIA